MDFKGRLDSINKDLTTGEFIIQIRTKENVLAAFQKLKDIADLSIVIKRFRKKRSLTANGYYWVLIGKVADAIGHSQAYMHNEMLRRHPRIAYKGDNPIYELVSDTKEAEKEVDEDAMAHLLPTSVTQEMNGVKYRFYFRLRGSHEYDTKEMAILIDDIIAEAKEQGIETLPPNEVERMKQEWGAEFEQKNEGMSI